MVRSKSAGHFPDDTPDKRIYRYVTWQKGGRGYSGGWIAQGPWGHDGKQITVCSRQATQLEAAELAAKAHGVTVTNLLLKSAMANASCSGRRPSKYLWLYWHGSHGAWQVLDGTKFVGMHMDEYQAALIVGGPSTLRC